MLDPTGARSSPGSAGFDPLAANEADARARTAEQLFRDHNTELVRFLRLKLRNDAEAQEIAQEAYVRLLQLRNTGAVGFLRAYLFKIAANLAIDRQREKRPSTQTWTPAVEFVADPFDLERSVLAAEDYQLFLQSLGELTPKCREAFVLHRLHKHSTQAVADHLRISPRMVRKYVSRALIYCRYRLDGVSASEAMRRLGQREATNE